MVKKCFLGKTFSTLGSGGGSREIPTKPQLLTHSMSMYGVEIQVDSSWIANWFAISSSKNIKVTAANRYTVVAVKLSALWPPSKWSNAIQNSVRPDKWKVTCSPSFLLLHAFILQTCFIKTTCMWLLLSTENGYHNFIWEGEALLPPLPTKKILEATIEQCPDKFLFTACSWHSCNTCLENSWYFW